MIEVLLLLSEGRGSLYLLHSWPMSGSVDDGEHGNVSGGEGGDLPVVKVLERHIGS